MSTRPPRGSVRPRPRGAAYVILTHGHSPTLARLVAAILASSPACQVFVAHDARDAPPPAFDDARVHVRAHGLATDWGSWELVAATLDAFAWARDTADPAMVALVSGQDYPVVRLSEWEDRLVTSGGWVGEGRALSYRPRWGKRHGDGDDELTRYTYRWFGVRPTGLARRLPPVADQTFWRVRAAIVHRIEPVVSLRHTRRGRRTFVGFRRLRTPFSTTRPCVKGSQWVALDRPLLDHLLAVTAPGTPLRAYYRTTVIPDEGLIPSVLSWIRPPIPDGPVTYVDWSVEMDAPRTLTIDDLEAVRASGAAFCRKVDFASSGPLVDALDAVNGVQAAARTPGVSQEPALSTLPNR